MEHRFPIWSTVVCFSLRNGSYIYHDTECSVTFTVIFFSLVKGKSCRIHGALNIFLVWFVLLCPSTWVYRMNDTVVECLRFWELMVCIIIVNPRNTDPMCLGKIWWEKRTEMYIFSLRVFFDLCKVVDEVKQHSLHFFFSLHTFA